MINVLAQTSVCHLVIMFIITNALLAISVSQSCPLMLKLSTMSNIYLKIVYKVPSSGNVTMINALHKYCRL